MLKSKNVKVFSFAILLICSILLVWYWHSKQVSVVFILAQITDSHCDDGARLKIVNATIQWIRSQPIDFVIHTGDLVQTWNNPLHWNNIHRIMRQLDGKQKWMVLAGNHDSNTGVNFTFFVNTFGENINSVTVFGNFAFIAMSWTTQNGTLSPNQLTWLDTQLNSHRNYKIIIAHHWLHSNKLEGHHYPPNPSVDVLWQHIQNYSNIILVLSGHNHENDYLRKQQVSFVTSKAAVDGYVRLFHFFSNGSILAKTRDVLNNKYLSDFLWITP